MLQTRKWWGQERNCDKNMLNVFALREGGREREKDRERERKERGNHTTVKG